MGSLDKRRGGSLRGERAGSKKEDVYNIQLYSYPINFTHSQTTVDVRIACFEVRGGGCNRKTITATV